MYADGTSENVGTSGELNDDDPGPPPAPCDVAAHTGNWVRPVGAAPDRAAARQVPPMGVSSPPHCGRALSHAGVVRRTVQGATGAFKERIQQKCLCAPSQVRHAGRGLRQYRRRFSRRRESVAHHQRVCAGDAPTRPRRAGFRLLRKLRRQRRRPVRRLGAHPQKPGRLASPPTGAGGPKDVTFPLRVRTSSSPARAVFGP